MNRATVLAGLIGLTVLAWSQAAAAQNSYQPPRTAEGHPDFSGVWATEFGTDIEPPKGVTKVIVTSEEAKAIIAKLDADAKARPEIAIDPDFVYYHFNNFAVVKGEIHTAMIIDPPDGKLPLTQKAIDLNKRAGEAFGRPHTDPEELDSSLRCLAGMTQAPIRALPFYFPYQFVQTKDAVVFRTEDGGGPRIIHLSGSPPPPAVVRSFEGYSAGHWDGDTLVVVTDHLRDDDHYRGALSDNALIVGADSKVIERFTRVSDTELFYEFTIDDPKYYTRPFRGEFSFTRKNDVVHEYACQEANYSLVNILESGGVEERAAEAKAAAESPAKPPARPVKTGSRKKPRPAAP